MNVTFITTVFNEENTISFLLTSLFAQSLLPDEIIIVDAGSTDNTTSIILDFFTLNKHIPSKLLVKPGNRSVGRNEAVKIATNEIIVCSDAGCILDKDWIKHIFQPFDKKGISVVSGFYQASYSTVFEKCLAAYTCVMPEQVAMHTFLPSSRSIAFMKTAWKTVGGYPEQLDTCEDLIFATKLKKAHFQFSFAKNAIVYWPQRKNIIQAFIQLFHYAQGDGKALYIRPQIPFLYLRYFFVILLAYILFPQQQLLLYSYSSLAVLYSLWAIGKNYRYVNDWHAIYILPLLQFTADAAVLWGTTSGFLGSLFSKEFTLHNKPTGMNNFQTVFKNTFFLTISEIFLKVIGLLWFIYLAHHISIELFGRYNIVNSFVGIFSFLPDLGVGLIVIREIAKDRYKASEYIGNSLLLNGLLGVFTCVIMLFTLPFFQYSGEVNMLIIIATITLFISTLRSVGIFFFDGIEKMGFSAILNSLNTVLLLSFAFLAFNFHQGLYNVFFGMLCATIVSLFITWITVKRYLTPKITLNIPLIKHLLSEGFPLGLASFAALVYSEVDSIMLSKMIGERSVGIYNSATPFIFSLIQLLNVPFVVAVYPALTRISGENSTRFKNTVIKAFGVIAFWSFPSAILISFGANYIIPFLFGTKYSEAIPILRLLIFYVPFASLSALLYKVLIIMRKQYYYLFITLFGALLNICLNLYFIGHFAIMGAAFSSVITQLILFLIYGIIVMYLLSKSFII